MTDVELIIQLFRVVMLVPMMVQQLGEENKLALLNLFAEIVGDGLCATDKEALS